MKIRFTTNVDKYETNCFPTNLVHPPRVGETVMVTTAFHDYFRSKKLPTSMVVVRVVHTEYCVICELHYSENDIKAAQIQGRHHKLYE